MREARSRVKVAAKDAKQPADMQATASVQETGTQRDVMKFMPGKISCSRYEQRVDNCTKEQLSVLLTSTEYQQWQYTRKPPKPHAWTASPAALLGFALLLVVPLLLMAPYYLHTPKQQVSIASSLQQAASKFAVV